MELPGGLVVGSSPSNAVDTGWTLVQEYPHVTEQLSQHTSTAARACSVESNVQEILSLYATTPEVCTPRACALQQETTAMRKSQHHNEEQPLFTAASESPCRAMKAWCSQIKN